MYMICIFVNSAGCEALFDVSCLVYNPNTSIYWCIVSKTKQPMLYVLIVTQHFDWYQAYTTSLSIYDIYNTKAACFDFFLCF